MSKDFIHQKQPGGIDKSCEMYQVASPDPPQPCYQNLGGPQHPNIGNDLGGDQLTPGGIKDGHSSEDEHKARECKQNHPNIRKDLDGDCLMPPGISKHHTLDDEYTAEEVKQNHQNNGKDLDGVYLTPPGITEDRTLQDIYDHIEEEKVYLRFRPPFPKERKPKGKYKTPKLIAIVVGIVIAMILGGILAHFFIPRKENSQGFHEILLLAERLEIHLISLDNNDYTDMVLPVSDVKDAMAIDYDHEEDYVYWTDVGTRAISRAHLDGSGQEIVVWSQAESPQGVAVDWIARNLYWTDTNTNHIEVSRLDGTSRKVLISEDLDEPRAITLDPYRGYMYWTAWGKLPNIERAFLDGFGRMQLVNTTIEWPIGIALDFAEEKLYWGDARTDRIEVINMDGTHRKIILPGSDVLQHIYGFTLQGNYIYWNDVFSGTIERMHKHNVKDREAIVDSLVNPRGLKAVNMDRITERQGFHGMLLLAQRLDLRQVCLDNNDYTDIMMQVADIKDAMAIDYDHVEDYVYWTDVGTKAISRAHLDGSDQEIVVESGIESPQGVAIDWIARKLYWTDTTANHIEVSRLNGVSRRVLLSEDLDEPRAITLDPNNGYMYWTAWGKLPTIERASLDGSSRVHLVNMSIEWPIGIALDFAEEKLYWGDARTDRIEVINMDGTNRKILLQGTDVLQHIYGLTLLGDYIYWNDAFSGTIERMHKHNVKDRVTIVDSLVHPRGIKAVNVYGITRRPGNK